MCTFAEMELTLVVTAFGNLPKMITVQPTVCHTLLYSHPSITTTSEMRSTADTVTSIRHCYLPHVLDNAGVLSLSLSTLADQFNQTRSQLLWAAISHNVISK